MITKARILLLLVPVLLMGCEKAGEVTVTAQHNRTQQQAQQQAPQQAQEPAEEQKEAYPWHIEAYGQGVFREWTSTDTPDAGIGGISFTDSATNKSIYVKGGLVICTSK